MYSCDTFFAVSHISSAKWASLSLDNQTRILELCASNANSYDDFDSLLKLKEALASAPTNQRTITDVIESSYEECAEWLQNEYRYNFHGSGELRAAVEDLTAISELMGVPASYLRLQNVEERILELESDEEARADA